MMRISTKGRYALRIMLELLKQAGERPVSIRNVSDALTITPKYLENIMAHLLQAELVTSIRGKCGGYKLARPAAQYSIYEILCAAEGCMELIPCTPATQPACPLLNNCEILPLWEGLDKVVRDYLGSITLAQLSAGKLSS